jgi:hypothetical protein
MRVSRFLHIRKKLIRRFKKKTALNPMGKIDELWSQELTEAKISAVSSWDHEPSIFP